MSISAFRACWLGYLEPRPIWIAYERREPAPQGRLRKQRRRGGTVQRVVARESPWRQGRRDCSRLFPHRLRKAESTSGDPRQHPVAKRQALRSKVGSHFRTLRDPLQRTSRLGNREVRPREIVRMGHSSGRLQVSFRRFISRFLPRSPRSGCRGFFRSRSQHIAFCGLLKCSRPDTTELQGRGPMDAAPPMLAAILSKH
jgi:hypothetical protein